MKRKVTALVIGVSNYLGSQALKNPVNDAHDISNKFRSFGFDVVVITNCTHKAMVDELIDFSKTLSANDVGIFFFAGHGIQIDGDNYLIATDTDCRSESAAKYSALQLNQVLREMSTSSVATNIVILDACRDNPWERSWNRNTAQSGLASVNAPKGTIIGYATSPGEVALDGADRNGTYTEALLDHIDAKDCSIEMMFKRVRNTVAAASGGRQTTWEHTSLAGEFYFNMSLAGLIGGYSDLALEDSRFITDPGTLSCEIIGALKSYNWYVQNPIFKMLNTQTVQTIPDNDMFVIGRNIYQAACGSSGNAFEFIEGFRSITNTWMETRRKAVLDGILFEIFFDSTGKLRQSIKSRLFNEVFILEAFEEFKSSFDFISDCVGGANAKYHAIPGKGHALSTTVTVEDVDGKDQMTGIFIGSSNILINETSPFDSSGPLDYMLLSLANFEEELSYILVVPNRLLTITYTPKLRGEGINVPVGWRVTSA